jgi:RimJ/RimL family protein N-acetyltransferase
MNGRPRLRAPTSADYQAIAAWIPDAQAAHRWAGPLLPFPFSAAELPALLAMPDGGKSSYCLEDGAGALRGFGQHWVIHPGAVHLGRIIVAPGMRGTGMGRALCELLISAALEATRARTVTLRVYRDNLPAVRLYQSLGFSEYDTAPGSEVLAMQAQFE